MKPRVSKIISAVVISTAALLNFGSRAATTFIWNVPTPGANNWNVNANWLPNTGNPAAGDTANFGETGTGVDSVSVNNVVSVNTTISTLNYTNTTSGTWHVTQIPATTTLTATNNLTVGGGNGPWTTSAALVDAGTLVVARNVSIGNNGTNAIANNTTLDLSGLSNFVSGASSATFTLGVNNRSVGNLRLASRSNYITAATIALNTANNSSSGSGTVTLGPGTNILNFTNFNAGGNRGQCTIQFADSNGGLRMRGAAGGDADRGTMSLGNHNTGGSGSSAAGTLLLNGHPVDIKLATLNLGLSSSGPTGTSPGNGTIQFDTGVIDATTINMGISSGTTASAVANGSITVGTNSTGGTNGVLLVGAGGIAMVNQAPASGASTGGLTNNNALIVCLGNIRKTNSLSTASIAISGGTLNMAAFTNTIGSTAFPIDNLTLTDSQLTLPAFSGNPSAVVTTLDILGSSDTINVSTVPGLGQFQLIQYAGLNGTFDFVAGTLPPAYQGYISNNVGASSVDLVITNVNTKTDTWRGNVNGNWDTSTLNWRSSGNPSTYGQGDIVIFDDTLTGTPNVNLTTSLLPSSINANNSSANYVFSGTGKLSGTASLTKSGTGSLTLAETGGDDFGGGVVVNDGTLVLDNANSAISGGVIINGGTLRIGNNDGNGALPSGSVTDNGALVFRRSDSVAVAVPISGTGSLTHGGSGTLTLGGANNYSGTTTVSNGTLAFSGSGTIASSAQVNVNAGTLDISGLSQSQTTLSGGLGLINSTTTVALTASGLPSLSSADLSFGGATNRINVLSFPTINSYPITFKIIQSANAASGTFNVGVGTLPAASPSYVASASQSGDQKTVLLTVTAGPLGTRPFVFWNGADVPNLNTNWSDRLNWFVPGAPVPGDVVVFNNTATSPSSALSTPGGGSGALIPGNIDNIVDANFTISSLTFTNDSDSYHNTFINNSRTLAMTNALTVGGFDSGAGVQHGFVTMSGGNASLNVNNASGNMQVWIGNANTSGSQATLDLSALDNLSATVSRFLVGATIGNVVNRPSGILYLAKTNSITAGFQTTTIDSGTGTANAGIVVADCNGNAGSRSFLYLGQVNTISADTIAVGRQKAPGTLLFNPTYANTAPYPSVTFQGFSSGRVSAFQVANGVGNSGTTTFNADANLRGGIVNAAINTLTVGRASTNGTGANTTTGFLEFDAGTINANTVNIGIQTTANSKSGVGTVSVSSNTVIGAAATLIVNGQLSLGSAAGGTGAASTSGTLNITNGTVNANMIVPGSASTITLAGGHLAATNAVGPLLNILELVPLGTPDNSRTDLTLPVDGSPGVTVSTLNVDGLGTTTNIIHVGSVGPVGAPPVELPLIQYAAMNVIGGTFNIGLGTLPAGYTGYLTNDTVNSMIAVVLTSVIHPQPRMTSSSQSGTNLVVSGTNGFAHAPYYVLASPDVTLPLSSWTPIATNVYDGNGNFTFITPIVPAIPNRFFAIQTP